MAVTPYRYFARSFVRLYACSELTERYWSMGVNAAALLDGKRQPRYASACSFRPVIAEDEFRTLDGA